jgi:tetratricopeptide (TPR) repeat protein
MEAPKDISTLHLNSAICLLQLYKFQESIQHSEKAINIDPNLRNVCVSLIN